MAIPPISNHASRMKYPEEVRRRNSAHSHHPDFEPHRYHQDDGRKRYTHAANTDQHCTIVLCWCKVDASFAQDECENLDLVAYNGYSYADKQWPSPEMDDCCCACNYDQP